jgi:hypothetical protein
MIFRNKSKFIGAVVLMGLLGAGSTVTARENVGAKKPSTQLKSTAAGCQPANSSIDLDVNNVRARLMTGGDMWWNQGGASNAAYEIPKGSGKHSQFAASCWIGGYDQQGQLKVAAQTYRQDGNDYWPGALDNDGKITSDQCAAWDKFWKVDRSTIKKFIQAYKTGGDLKSSDYDAINEWPAVGNPNVKGQQSTKLSLNPNNTYAPFIDINGDGKYQPEQGEYPDIRGDQYIWWVFNDAGNVKQQSLTAAMGIEVQTSAFAFATQDFLNNATFCNYRVINRGPLTIDSTYIAVWDDCDLGYYLDDFIGCDTSRGLGIMYNATNNDGQSGGSPKNSYGLNPPQVGLDYFQGPKRTVKLPSGKDTVQQLKMTNFTYYNNDPSIIGNPNNGIQIYYYMTGSIRNGERFSYDFTAGGVPSKGYGSGPVSPFVFWGDPSENSQWSECACGNNPGDRRFIFSSGPFQLKPGAVNDITFGCVWASGTGGCPSTSFKTIKNIDDGAQALFDNNFKTVEGPEAPRLVVRELDRKLAFYLVNDYGSNNFGENYGRSDGPYNDSLLYHQIVVKSKGVSDDSLYKFQGYRVFQLANSQVSTAEIFDPITGEVDPSKAVEVFQCDIADSVSQIVNYTKNLPVSDTTHIAQIKVKGKDSGIVHSFVLTQDQFATGNDKRFVNYRNYYFTAIAYAYNNFKPFDPKNTVSSQDVPYLGSAHSAGGNEIKIVAALPNPSNGAMGTTLNSDYGDGVVITRIQGTGNGGLEVQMDEASENTAVNNGSVSQPVYLQGLGPVNVKVIDPVKVPAMDWVLQIHGANELTGTGANAAYVEGIVDSGSWTLTGYGDGGATVTIYGEKSIGTPNEQILADYGLSVSIKQVAPPGSQAKGTKNGYIHSNVVFEDPSQPWLWGVNDESDSSFANWLRCGSNSSFGATSATNPCNFNDIKLGGDFLDPKAAFGSMMSNFSPTKASWGPYGLAAGYFPPGSASNTAVCGHHPAAFFFTRLNEFKVLPDVDLVFTSDKSKWTRCAVLELQEDENLAENKGKKFFLRKHKGWNKEVNANGSPKYSESADDEGMSWFPGYAIDQNTGERLNIVFGEDSYLSSDNGNDMIWNPSSPAGFNGFNPYDNSIVFGGKHYVYIQGTKYDSGKTFVKNLKAVGSSIPLHRAAYSNFQWVGLPMLNPNSKLLSLNDGLIPTTTRLRFRVDRPYMPYAATDTTTAFNKAGTTIKTGQASNPYYTFSTKELAPSKLSDTTDRNRFITRIQAVPNPYYGYSGYEKPGSRFDTKVRIINLPAKAEVRIYSLDGTLVRTLSKSDPGTSYIDWDIRNSVGLPIASGMYLMHVKAEGLGETVIKWFGSLRPLDVTQY